MFVEGLCLFVASLCFTAVPDTQEVRGAVLCLPFGAPQPSRIIISADRIRERGLQRGEKGSRNV